MVGNTDEMLWNTARRAEQEDRAPRLHPLLRLLFEDSAPATRKMLGEHRIGWLKTLPREWRFEQILVVHARPDDLWSAPMPDAPDEELVTAYGGRSAAVVVYGHIHRPYVRPVSASLTVANSGSAGLAHDGDWRASYLLLESEGAMPQIRRVEYDLEREVRELSESGYPNQEWLAQIKRTGRFQPPPGSVLNRGEIDSELRSLIAAIEGLVREPLDRSYHLHQLDGARLEAMVYLDPGGARIAWVHGKGDCAITGDGAAILAVLRGEGDPGALETEGRLVLYGDRDLVGVAAKVFDLAAS